MRPSGIRRRLMWAFALQALLVCALFSLLGLVLVYSLEDEVFNRMLRDEVQRQHAHRATHGQWTTPERAFISLHERADTLPSDVKPVLAREPARREIAGEQGRHYHAAPLQMPGAPAAWLLAEVSDSLVVRPSRSGIFRFLGLATGIVFALALALGFWLAHRTLRPVARLAASVQQAPQGLLPAGFSAAYPSDEIGALARGLDDAMQRVAAFVQREQRFTADASHELRTPLAVIAGAAELLRARQDLSPGAMKAVQRIELACRQMQQAVQTLLTLAREPDARLQQDRLDLHGLVDEVLQTQRQHGVEATLVNEVPPGLQVQGNAAVLQLVLANLTGNALQHGAGPVSVSWDQGALHVRDHGPGIPPTLQPQVGRRGVKGEHSAGFGLGLAIVHRLCDSAGLTLQLSTPDQGGVVASVALPAAGHVASSPGRAP